MSVIVRPTGILIEKNKLLLLKQEFPGIRHWSLPGGRQEPQETIQECLLREMREETGFQVRIKKLLYICDRILADKTIVHITFLIKRLHSIPNHTIAKDTYPIHGIHWAPIQDLEDYGFGAHFTERVNNNFPDSGTYLGNADIIGI